MKSPITDKTLGIVSDYNSVSNKFRDVRAKAKFDEVDRHKKFKRAKGKVKIALPKFKIGDEVVVTSGWNNQQFHLVEILDFEEKTPNTFSYFSILKKTTDPKLVERIGRLLYFYEGNWWRTDYAPANVENKNIRWSMG